MRKGNMGRLLFCCLLMLLFCAGCKNDKETELREIKSRGECAVLRTQYGKDDIAEKYTIEVYTEERRREEKYFDEGGNRNGYAVFEYDDKNCKTYKAEDVGKGINQEVFYTTSYFYDEEGRLSREEIFATGKPYAYIVYEYEGLMLVKEDKYRVGDNNDSYWEGCEYEYDEKGRVVKCIDYDKSHNSTGYTIYEYR